LGGYHAKDAGQKVAHNGNNPQPAHHTCTVVTAVHEITL
jgi:hypothetical protein